MKPLAELYALADPVFFDDPATIDADGGFPAGHAPLPAGWERERNGPWVVLRPPGTALPPQGWKVHVSATPDNCHDTVQTVVDWCLEHGVTVKFLAGPALVRAHNLKYAPRASSGKVLALYPVDEAGLRHCLEELDTKLDGADGPYVLSDLRYRAGPLYVRYGGFVSRWCSAPDGERVLAVERPDGELVPDERRPVFTVPDWVTVPECLADSVAARRAAGTTTGYRVTEALHFSNGGGVYAGVREDDGREVVLKEARPHAGLATTGSDAVRRLEHEVWALRRLDGLDGVPALVDEFTVADHRFVAMSRVPGSTLQLWLALNHPFIGGEPTDAERSDYTARALRLHGRVRELVEAMHERGVVFGDLHPANILVDPDGRVGLVDFENAFAAAEPRRQSMGHAGFVAPDKEGADVDRHALAVLALWLFLPLTSLLGPAPDKLDALVDVAAELFALPDELTGWIRDGARGGHAGPPAVSAGGRISWPAASDSMVRAISASASPERTDRLYPGDIELFRHGGATFAHGAAGVLWVLATQGRPVDPDHVRWLRDRAAEPVQRAGLLDGAHGTAHVLELLGHPLEAIDLVRRAGDEVLRTTDLTYSGGLAGIGLNLLHLAGRLDEGGLTGKAVCVGRRVASALGDGAGHGIDKPPGALGRSRDSGTRGGLLHGWSGPALLFLELHRATGERDWLDLAVRAVHRDLDLCLQAPDGSLQVDGGFRTLPYLEVGSAGIALVADELLRHTDDTRIEAALPSLIRACHSVFVMEPNLFMGRAGLMAVISRLSRASNDRLGERQAKEHLDRLGWHSLAYHGHVSFPGDGCGRLSMDFGSGNAGVLAAAGSVVNPELPFLPFLPGPDGS